MDAFEKFFPDEPVPPLQKPEESPPVRSRAELTTRWRQLMGPGGFGRRCLWLLWFDERGYQLPVIMPIDDIPKRPDDLLVGNLMGVLLESTQVDGSVAMLLSRSGGAAVCDSDRLWARALLAHEPASMSVWPLHLATTDRVRPLTADDIGDDLLESA